MRSLCTALTALCLSAGALVAQESRGAIIGRVSDPTGAIVAGARVQVRNSETNVAISAVTNKDGNYEVPYLVSGHYSVTAEAAGFKRSVRDGIEVRVSDRLTINFELTVGDSAESVTVTSEAPLIDTATGSVGTVMDGRRATELPIAGGNAYHLARFTPGLIVTGGHAPGNPTQDLAAGAIAVGGTRTGSNEVTLDGAPNTYRGQSTYSAPPQDMVEEFRIQSATYDASLGHSAGAVVNVSTKGGTNIFHGTGYLLNSTIRAVPWFSNRWLYDTTTGPINEDKRRQANPGWNYKRWGGTANGPVVLPKLYDGRNKTFWSFGYEGMQVKRQATYIATFPTDAERVGDFSDLLKIGANYQIYDPATAALQSNGRVQRQPLAGNIVPASRISPIAKNILGYWPKPNVPGTVDFRQNYFKVEDETWTYKSISGRLDQNFSARHRFFLRAGSTEFDQKVRSFPSEATGTRNNPLGYRAAMDDVYVFNPSLLLNVRYGLVYQRPLSRPMHAGFDLTTLGFPDSLKQSIGRVADLGGLSFPAISVDGLDGLGGGGGSMTSIYYHTLGGTLTRMAGAHSMKMGAEYRLMRDNGFAYGNVAPSYSFSTNWTRGPLDTSPIAPTGQGLASLLLGLPTSGSVDVNASSALQSQFGALFFHDDWKVSPRLTLNLGLRYELESSVTERFNRSLLDYDFTTPSPIEAAARANYAKDPIPEIASSAFHAIGGLRFAGVNGAPRQLWPADKNNFMPRFGLAYQLRSSTVIRAGYGIFFSMRGVDRNQANQGGFSQSTNLVPSLDNGLTFRATLANPFVDGIQVPPGASQGLSTYLGRAITFFYQNPVNAYMQRWSMSIQHQLPARLMFDLSYMGNRGTKLGVSRNFDPTYGQYFSTAPVRDQATIDYLGTLVTNPFASIPEFAGTGLAAARIARSQLLRPYPQFQSITATEPTGYSWYHSMQLNVEKRMSKGVLFQAAWTWSKFMEATSRLNDSDPMLYRTISDLDATHRFVASVVYELPLGKGKPLFGTAGKWVNKIVGGWQVEGVYEGQTGFPLGFGNAIFNGDLHNIAIPVSERKAERWFNTDAGFERSSSKQLGSNIRTFPIRFSGVRGDGVNNFDLSMMKNVAITEKIRGQFRMEGINALNHVQFAAPNTTVTSSAFGSITGELGHGQRQLNFVFKVLF